MILKFKLEKLLKENNNAKLHEVVNDMIKNNFDMIYRNVNQATNVKENFTYKNDIIHITINKNKLIFGINGDTYKTDIETTEHITVSKYDILYSYIRISVVTVLSMLFLYYILKQ